MSQQPDSRSDDVSNYAHAIPSCCSIEGETQSIDGDVASCASSHPMHSSMNPTGISTAVAAHTLNEDGVATHITTDIDTANNNVATRDQAGLNLVKCDNSSDEMKENANSSNINGNLNDISSTYLTTHQSNSAFQSANIHKRQLEQEQWQQNKLRKLNIKQIQDFIMPIYDKPLVGQSALISDSYNSSSSTTTFLHSSSSSSSQPPLSNIVTSYQLSDHAHTSSSNCTPIAEWISPYLSMFKLLTTGEQINPLPWTACNINFSNNLIIDGAQGRIYYGYLDVGRLEQLVGHADISKEQLVVFKNFKIPPKYADNSELQAKYLANFHHEIVCSLSVNSPYSTVNAPHMVRSYGFTLDPSTTPLDGLYLVMKYYPEGTVHDLIHSNPSSLSFKDRLSLALDMVYGVNELHTAGLVHQDIKPSQFLCYRTNDGVAHACLADLGSTYPMNEAGVVLDSGLPLYLTHLYTAPETAVSEQQKHHSIQTDYLQLSLSLIFFLLNQDDLNKHYAPSVSLAARAAAADAHARVNDLGSIDVKKRNQFRLRSLQMAIITAMECHSQPHRMDAIDLMLLPTSSSSNVQPTITRQMLLEAARRVPILALDVESAARITDSANHMLKELSVYLRLADQPSFTRDRLLSIVVIQDTELQQDSSAALNKQVNCVLIQLHPATGLLTMVCPVLVGLYKLDAATRFKLLNTLISGYNLDPVATFSSGLRSVCIRKDSCEFMMQAYVELDLTGRWCWEPQALVAPFTLFILATERIRADVRAVCNGRIVLCSDEEMKEYFERQCQAVGEEKMQRLFEGAALVTMHEPITANEIDEAVLKLKEMMGEHLFSEEQIRKALQQHGTVEETLNALLEFAQESAIAHGALSHFVEMKHDATNPMAFWKGLGTTLSMSTAYHPQSDDQTENANKALEIMLRSVLDFDQQDWDTHLAAAELAINNAVNVSTGYSPFYLMYGREAVLPLELSMSQLSRARHNPAAAEDLERWLVNE